MEPWCLQLTQQRAHVLDGLGPVVAPHACGNESYRDNVKCPMVLLRKGVRDIVLVKRHIGGAILRSRELRLGNVKTEELGVRR